MGGLIVEVDGRGWNGEVLESEMPVLVEFWGEWCAPCHRLEPILGEIAAEKAGRVRILKLDTEANPEIVMRYEVRAAPTLLLFGGGAELWRSVGFRPKARLEAELEELLAPARDAAYGR